MGEIELENTFLVRHFPSDLFEATPLRIIDIYLPAEAHHPRLRLRAQDDSYTLTKKAPIDGDASRQLEQSIILTADEFDAFAEIEGKLLVKDRYEYFFEGSKYEFDVFREDLLGLVLVDIEFETLTERDTFEMPDFCLADVTFNEWVAGGMLAGKTMEEIQDYLVTYNYKPLL